MNSSEKYFEDMFFTITLLGTTFSKLYLKRRRHLKLQEGDAGVGVVAARGAHREQRLTDGASDAKYQMSKLSAEQWLSHHANNGNFLRTHNINGEAVSNSCDSSVCSSECYTQCRVSVILQKLKLVNPSTLELLSNSSQSAIAAN